ncbi:MAG: UDP-glucose/GDP-mannose dehydrogenase family protein [Acidobacteria bacterium]|nr:UDP-glucose/GDP-mannose dehydrogenase family protein [Acidobacteriota bacterium]
MRVSVFGLGYVGCVTGTCLAQSGHHVVGVDVNDEKVEMLNEGRPPVLEPGLGDVLARVVRDGRLRATTDAEEAVRASDVALVCVGTPGLPNGRLDVGALERASREIGHALLRRTDPYTVVVRSTVLPGTTESVVVPALLAGGALRFGSSLHVAVNPEFMREGSSLRDFARPPMTLVGCDAADTGGLLRELYAGVEAPFVRTAVRTAEMAKYVANAFHALKVCFANEVGDVCAALGVDAQEVMRVFLVDRKLSLSEAYLRPGFAFGGSCLPKDVRALVYGARSADVLPPLLSSILPSNEVQIRRGVDAVLAARKRRVGVVGLAFKEGTDDLRESPMVALVETLVGKGCDVRILDRHVAVSRLVGANRRYIEEQIPHVASLMCDSVEALLAHAEVLVIGNTGPEAAAALAGAGPDHTLVDLTRGAARKAAVPEAAA